MIQSHKSSKPPEVSIYTSKEFQKLFPSIYAQIYDSQSAQMDATIAFVSSILHSDTVTPYRKFYAMYLLFLSAHLKDHSILNYIAKSGSLAKYIFEAAQYYSPKTASSNKKADRFFSAKARNNDAILSINFTRLCLEAIIQWAKFTDEQQQRNSILEIFSQYCSYLKKHSNIPQDYWFTDKDYDLSTDISVWNFKLSLPVFKSADKDDTKEEITVEIKTENKPQIPRLMLQEAVRKEDDEDSMDDALVQDKSMAESQSRISNAKSQSQGKDAFKNKSIGNFTIKIPPSEDHDETKSAIQNRTMVSIDLRARRTQTDLVMRGRTSTKKVEAHNIKNLFQDLSPQCIRSPTIRRDNIREMCASPKLTNLLNIASDAGDNGLEQTQIKSLMSTSPVLKFKDDFCSLQASTFYQSIRTRDEATVSISRTSSTLRQIDSSNQTKRGHFISVPRRDFSREIAECGRRISKASVDWGKSTRINTASLNHPHHV